MKTHRLNNIESVIIELRNQKVILDSDVVVIYGVETRAINQAVQRNIKKFPQVYIFELNKKEWQSLKSQNVTSKGGKVKLPKAFTEKGLYMLATVLKSKQATQATLQIIETFAKSIRGRRNENTVKRIDGGGIRLKIMKDF